MLKKVKRIKLGIRAYRRIMRRVLDRDNWRFQKCGSPDNLQVHHKTKRSQQGNDSLGNLVTLCSHCRMAEHGQLGYQESAVSIITKSDVERRSIHNSLLRVPE